jgi:hypothetical protein
MRRTVIGSVLAALAFPCAFGIATMHAQGIPQPSPNATACAYLPIPDLEKHFGTKAAAILGLDQNTRNTCAARFPDPLHTAAVESHSSSAADLAMTAAQRLAFLKQAMKEVQDTRDFGAIGCFQSTMDMGKPVRVTTCFLAKAPYLSLALQSVDPAQVGYDAVRGFLETAASRRK